MSSSLSLLMPAKLSILAILAVLLLGAISVVVYKYRVDSPADNSAETLASQGGAQQNPRGGVRGVPQINHVEAKPTEFAAAEALSHLRELIYSPVPDNSLPGTELKQTVLAIQDESASALKLLCEALQGDYKEARFRAACAIGLLGQKAYDALPLLLQEAASDPELPEFALSSAVSVFPRTQLISEFVQAYRNAPERRRSTFLSATSDAIEKLASDNPELAAEIGSILAPLLTDPDPELRAMAALRLAHLPGEKNPAVVTELAKELSSVRHSLEAIQLLKILGSSARPAIPAIQEFLRQTPETNLHQLAVETLAAVAPELSAHQPEVAQQVATDRLEAALKGRIERGEATVPELVSALDSRWAVRDPALMALRKLGPAAATALPALRARFQRSDSQDCLVREFVAKAIKAIDPDSPRIWFSRDEVMPSLRAAADTIRRPDASLQKVLFYSTRGSEIICGYDGGQLAAMTSQLRKSDPELCAVFIDKMRAVDSKTADSLARQP